MTIIEKALTRLETIEKQEKDKSPSDDDLQQGPSPAPSSSFAPSPMSGIAPGSVLEPSPMPKIAPPSPTTDPTTDFVVDRVKRRRNRQRWIAPVLSITVAIFIVLFSWRTNLLNIRQLVENSEMYSFVTMMLESTEPLTLPKIARKEAPPAPKSIPESSPSLITPITPVITPVEKPRIVVSKPEGTRKEAARASPKIKEFSWIKKGWLAFDGKKLKAAFKLWEAGMRSLPKKHLVLVAGVHKNRGDALKELRRIGKGNSAFVVKGEDFASGKNVYYLLSAPYRKDLQSVRKRMAKTLNRGRIRGNYANKLLARMHPPGKTAKASASTGKKKQTVVAKTIGKNAKQAKTKRIQKSTLSYGQRISFVKDLLGDSLYSEAVDNLKPLFDTPPGVWEPYLLMGTAYMGLGDLEVADSYFKKGLAVDKNRPRLWLQRAVVAQQQGDHNAALEILRKVETFAPRMPEIKLNIGYSSDVLGKTDNAAKAYQSFLALTEGRRTYFSLRLQVVQRLLELGYQPTE